MPKTGLNHALCYASVWLLSAFGLVCDRWCRTGQVSGWPPTPTPTDSGLHPPPFQPHVSFGSIHWYLLLLLLYLYLYFYFHWYVLLLVPCCNSHSWGRVIHICFRSAMRSIFQYKSDIGLNIKLDIRPFKSGQSVLTRGQCSAVQSKTAVTDVAPPSLVWVECYTETKAICNAESEHNVHTLQCIADCLTSRSEASWKRVRPPCVYSPKVLPELDKSVQTQGVTDILLWKYSFLKYSLYSFILLHLGLDNRHFKNWTNGDHLTFQYVTLQKLTPKTKK